MHHRNLRTKIRRLCRTSVWYKFSNPDIVVNFSSRTLSEEEKFVLGPGLSFNLNATNDDCIDTATTVDEFFRFNKNSIENAGLVRGVISPFLVSLNRETPALPRRLNKALADLRKDDSIRTFPADKGGKFVILDTDASKQKTLDLLNGEVTYEKNDVEPTRI